MNLMEEWSFGRLVHFLRTLTNQNAEDIIKIFGYAATSWLYDYERDNGMYPSLERVKRFGDVYPMYPNVYTYLLRASNYPLTEEEWEKQWEGRLKHLVSESRDPMYVLDYRYRLMAYNQSFAAQYDGAGGTTDETIRLPVVPRAGLIAPRRGEEPSSPGRVSSGGGEHDHQYLSLSVGMPFLLLVFSPLSRLRRGMELEQWQHFSHYFLVRFWRTTIPLMQRNWYKKTNGEPEWLPEMLAQLIALPEPFGGEFLLESSAVRQRVEDDPNHPSVQLFDDFIHDSVVFWQGGTLMRLQTSELSDGRLILFRHSPVGGA